MSEPGKESYNTRRQQLARLLMECSDVTRLDAGDDADADGEAWTLAHAFLDLEESFTKFNCELLPALERGNLNSEDVSELLQSIGEEFRHILYHIGDPKFFRYLPGVDRINEDFQN